MTPPPSLPSPTHHHRIPFNMLPYDNLFERTLKRTQHLLALCLASVFGGGIYCLHSFINSDIRVFICFELIRLPIGIRLDEV